MSYDEVGILFGLSESEVERLMPILAWVDTQWRTQQHAYPDDSPGTTQTLKQKLRDDSFRKLLSAALSDESWMLTIPEFDDEST